MPSCVVLYCKSRYGKSAGRDFSLFSFPPVNNTAREKWIQFVQIERRDENWIPSAASKLCSKHFCSNNIYYGEKGRPVLKKGSVPCTKSEGDDTDDDEINVETNRATPVNLHVSGTDSIFDSPRKITLNSQIKKLQIQQLKHQAKIKNLGHENRYLNHKILSLSDLVKHLEKKFDIEKHVTNTLRASAETQALFDRLNKKSKKAGLSRQKFSPSLRKFALTLHYYSPPAYKYARKCFNNVFPHARTLHRSYVSIDAQPGFTSESFRALKLKRCKTGKELICSLVFTEISITRKKILHEKMNEGFVNLGFGDIREEIASQALVFMVVSLDQNWKIPVGYFLIHSMAAESKAKLIKQCLSLCHEAGVKIVSMTFDGAPTNLNTAEILGCKLSDPDKLKTDFPHPDNQESVVIFLDPSHMMKLVRNTFESKNIFYTIQYNTNTLY